MNTKLNNKTNIQVKYLTLIPLFTALTAIGAFIKIPIGPVPMSLQVIFVLLSSILLGKYAYISQLLYLLLGLMGLPIFTSGGGALYLLSPTFGFIIGFIISSYVIGNIIEKKSNRNKKALFFISILGVLIIHFLGVSYLYILKNFLVQDSSISFLTALKLGSLPFIPSDIFWCFVASNAGYKLIQILDLYENKN